MIAAWMKRSSSFALAGLLALLVTPQLFAQPLRRPSQSVVRSSLMSPPREALSLLEDIERAVESKEWSEATLSIGSLLGLDGEEGDGFGTDYFILLEEEAEPDPTAKKPPRGNRERAPIQTSLFAKIYNILDSLPDEAIEILNVRYGVDATRQLQTALEAGDWKAVQTISSKFGFLAAGQDATLMLAERSTQQGDNSRASMFYRLLFAQNRALKRYGPDLGIATAASLLSAGEEEQSKQILNDLKSRVKSFKSNWKGLQIQWDSDTVDVAKVLDTLRTQYKDTVVVDRAVTQPKVSGGNARRNANTRVGVPLPILRWHYELHESQVPKANLATALKNQLNGSMEQSITTIPSRVPISVGRNVIVMTYDQRPIAIDALTGRLQWEYPYSGMPLGFSLDKSAMRGGNQLDLGVPDYLAKRVWGESALGHLSSDGIRLYGLNELPSLDVSEALALGPAARFGRPNTPRPANVLQCWSIPEEGRILWEIGGQKNNAEPLLSNTLFLGPPLPVENELLVLGELNGDVCLFSLQPETGKLNWQQPLVSNTSGVIAVDVLRRSVGATPSLDGNIAVCPTLSGFLVGFDIHSKTLKWSLEYPLRENTSSAMVGQFGGVELGSYSPFEARPVDLAPVIGNGIAVCAPIDGLGVFAVSTVDGKVRWKQQSANGQIRYVGAVVDNRVLVVGQNIVMGFDAQKGRELWPTIRLKNGTHVVGKGVRNDSTYYIPTSEPSILAVDMKSGKVTESIKLEQTPGNLICVNDKLISASPFQVECYLIRSIFEEEIKAVLASNSVSIQSLLDRSELALADGKIEEAMDILEKAYELAPDDKECWLRLRKASTAALNKDFEKYVDRVSRFKIGLENDFVFLRTLVYGLQKQKRYEQVVLKLLELSDARVTKRRDQMNAGDYFDPTPALSIQEDRWIESQLEKVLRESPDVLQNPELQEAFRSQIQKISKLQPNLQRLKLKHLRAYAGIAPARNALAEDMLNQSQWLGAEEILLEQIPFDSIRRLREINPEGNQLLAKVYAATGRMKLAESLLVGNEESIAALRKWIKEYEEGDINRMPLQFALESIAAEESKKWPSGKIQVTAVSSFEAGNIRTITPAAFLESSVPCKLRMQVGEAFQDWEASWISNNNVLNITNKRTGYTWSLRVGQFGMEKGAPNIYPVDGKLVLEANRTIVVIDLLRGPSYDERNELWHKMFETPQIELERGRGRPLAEPKYWGLPVLNKQFRVAAVGRQGIIVLEDETLSCHDLATNSVLWSHTGFQNASVAIDGSKLIALLPSKKIVELDVSSGYLLGERNFDAALPYAYPLDKRMLFADEAKRMLRLVDMTNGQILCERSFSADTVLGLNPAHGLVALDNAGKMHFWNFKEGKEYEHTVKLQDDLLDFIPTQNVPDKRLSLQEFGDKLLVLPYCSAYEYKNAQIGPLATDPSYAPVSGSMFAISPIDGKPLWDHTLPIKQYGFPLQQNRTDSPVAFLVRRIIMPKVNDGKAAEIASLVILDVDKGEVLYERDDVPGIRSVGFTQMIMSQTNRIKCFYSGVQFEVEFTETPGTTDNAKQAGIIDMQEYTKRISARLKELREKANQPPQPLQNQPGGPQNAEPNSR